MQWRHGEQYTPVWQGKAHEWKRAKNRGKEASDGRTRQHLAPTERGPPESASEQGRGGGQVPGRAGQTRPRNGGHRLNVQKTEMHLRPVPPLFPNWSSPARFLRPSRLGPAPLTAKRRESVQKERHQCMNFFKANHTFLW